MDTLRIITAGSADGGKSTLIGRLFLDQQAAIDDDCRYFATPKRKFIIADTSNMVTGASTADLAIVLIDAQNGVLTQTKRHSFLASLLGIHHLLIAVNKMDLVEWSEVRFRKIVEDYTAFSEKLKIHDITFIPVSALKGDNIIHHGDCMDWYEGPTVLHHLETVTIAADRNLTDFRFPIQYVIHKRSERRDQARLDSAEREQWSVPEAHIRPHQGFRGFAGRVASGTVSIGEEVTALPSGRSTKIRGINGAGRELEMAGAGETVILTLEDEIDLSRGEMLVRSHNLPVISTRFDAMLFWMDESASLKIDSPYYIRHTTREVQVFVRGLNYRVDVNTLHRDMAAETLNFNEIGRLAIETSQPLFFDPYETNREIGGFILIDPSTNRTVGTGMIRGETRETPDLNKSANVVWYAGKIGLEEREERNGHGAVCYWFTGLSGAGKSTLARAFEQKLFNYGRLVYVIDGDNVRHGLNGDLGFTAEDREENIRRVGHVARLMYDAGFIVLCCFISPTRALRTFVRGLFPEGRFNEVHVKCSLDECIRRDPKGLYKKALAGEIPNFTGVSAPYEEPDHAEFILDTANRSIEECVGMLQENNLY